MRAGRRVVPLLLLLAFLALAPYYYFWEYQEKTVITDFDYEGASLDVSQQKQAGDVLSNEPGKQKPKDRDQDIEEALRVQRERDREAQVERELELQRLLREEEDRKKEKERLQQLEDNQKRAKEEEERRQQELLLEQQKIFEEQELAKQEDERRRAEEIAAQKEIQRLKDIEEKEEAEKREKIEAEHREQERIETEKRERERIEAEQRERERIEAELREKEGKEEITTQAPVQSGVVNGSANSTAPDPYNGILLAIGIASMRRGTADAPRSTLLNTMKYVVPKILPEERETTRVIVFNLQSPPEDHDQIDQVAIDYKDDIESGFIQIVTNRAGYGDLLNPALIEQTHNDTMGRILWRSKENLDFAYVVDYCGKIGKFVLFLEDDVKATTDFISKAMHYFTEPPLDDMKGWLFFSLYTPYPGYVDKKAYPFGCCTQSIIFQSDDIPALTKYINERYAKDPVDWLMRDYLEAENRKMYVAIPNLFQHVTTVSTLKEKDFVHTSPTFRE